MKTLRLLNPFLFFPAIALLFAVSSCTGNGSPDDIHNISSDKPNIIFIMADDLGYGDLGSYGQKVIQTPHLDKMAAEGMRFTQCYAGSTVCAPSRSVLMTGQHMGHTHVRGNAGGTDNRQSLRPEDVTVAELLKTL